MLALLGPWLAFGDSAVRAQTADKSEVCVDVQIGQDRTPYYDCLNRQLRNSVPPSSGSATIKPPYDAHSPAYQVGGYNQAAVREQLGSAFGHSVTPQRPPMPKPPAFPPPHR